jgi:hypothetical protein
MVDLNEEVPLPELRTIEKVPGVLSHTEDQPALA